jgi:DNA mismatch endonuclease, patch repair protein
VADHLSTLERSKNMAAVRSRDTTPELAVRKIAHGLGYRYRLNVAELPGTPDLVFPRLRKVIFVHGCFWHRHHKCRYASMPQTRVEFWQKKFDANMERDRFAQLELRKLGWDVMVIWQCGLRNSGTIAERLARFLAS